MIKNEPPGGNPARAWGPSDVSLRGEGRGVSDAISWVHREFGRDAPLLFDRDYAPKPAYFGARAALAMGRSRPSPGPG